MSDGYVIVQPDSTGKKVQTFESTVAGQVVEAQAVVVVDSAGSEILRARDTRNVEEMRLLAEDTKLASYRQSARERLPSIDRRGGCGQRGTIR